jgi:hypothetical protein
MQTAVIVLNTVSCLASLATVWIGSRIILVGLLGLQWHDYSGIELGVALVATFLIAPPICVVVSTKLANRSRPSSILVALMPMALIVLSILVLLAVIHA